MLIGEVIRTRWFALPASQEEEGRLARDLAIIGGIAAAILGGLSMMGGTGR